MRYVIMGGFIFAVVWSLLLITTTWSEYAQAISALRDSTAAVATGRVENYVPSDGHRDESFQVGGVRFAYADASDFGGFHRTALHGGPIHPYAWVRIRYLQRGSENVIIMLETCSAPADVKLRDKPLEP